jgi:hypothetical protein
VTHNFRSSRKFYIHKQMLLGPANQSLKRITFWAWELGGTFMRQRPLIVMLLWRHWLTGGDPFGNKTPDNEWASAQGSVVASYR